MRRLLALITIFTLCVTPVFSQKKDTYKVRTVVIDPGHGGAKPGARGGRSLEKNITLAVAKKFGKLISDNYPNVKVIYTRTTDVDISLAERAHIANRNKADLFISIHANSHPTSSPTGVETFVMGLSESRANLEVAKKENADILLEDDYKSNKAYEGFDPNSPENSIIFSLFQNAFLEKSLNFAQAIQNQYKKNLKTINRGVKQAELFVLYKTSMPSVLTEIGFISNPAEEAFMNTEEGQAQIAICLFNAFMNFKASEEGTSRIANPKIDISGYHSPGETKPKPEEQQVAVNEPVKQQPKTDITTRPVPSVEPIKQKEAPVETQEVKPEPQVKPQSEVIVESVATPKEELIKEESQPEIKKEPWVEPQQKPTPQVESSAPAPQPVSEPVVKQKLAAPINTAKSDAQIYYTVQFATSSRHLDASDPDLGGVPNIDCYRNGTLYCYSVGRFAAFQDASKYCAEVQDKTPFNDAWVVSRKAVDAISLAPKAATEKKSIAESQVTPAPKPTTATKARPGMAFTVQFASLPRLLKKGDPDLFDIRDFKATRAGRYYVYTAGNYATREEAEARCATIKSKTPFKDAIVIEVKK